MAARVKPEEAAILAVRAAMEAGATEAEAYVEVVRGSEATAMNNRVAGVRGISEAGVGVRAVVGKKVGFSFAASLELNEIREAARRAVAAARAAPEDPYWSGFPEPSDYYPRPEGTYDSSIAGMRVSRVVSELKAMLDEALSVEGVNVERALVRSVVVEKALASTSATLVYDIGTIVLMWIGLNVVKDNVVTPVVYEVDYGRVSVPSARMLARRAVEEATRSLATEKLTEPRRMSVVFHPKALGELLEYTLLQAITGEAVARGASPYAGRIGEQVMDERLTIIDDGLMRQGFETWRFDGEGVAQQRTVVVEKGVFKTPLYNSYWASRMNTESTGNARRSYMSTPRIGATNVVIEPGDAGIDELLEGEVLLVTGVQGAHSSNTVTGEYSVVASPAWIVRKGEYRLVQGVMIAGNIYEQLAKSIEMIGSWQERLPGLKAPWVRIGDVVVTPRM